MRRHHLMIGLVLLSAPAQAQTSDDAKAILQAITGINQRLDGMQKQIDELKSSKVPVPTASPEPSGEGRARQTTTGSALPAGMRPEPGWVINAIPGVANEREPDPLFRFPQRRLPISFSAHLAAKNISNWLKYRGEAQFQAFEAGRHVFNFEFRSPANRDVLCTGYLKVGNNVLINLGNELKNNEYTKVPQGHTISVTGATTLDRGRYDITFLVACWPDGNYNSALRGEMNYIREPWQATTFDVQIRGPKDDTPRIFAPNELFHLAPERRASSQSSTANSVPIRFVTANRVRTMIRKINVRAQPDLGAPVSGTLEPGQQVRIVATASNQEWHRVAVGERFIGFVKATALDQSSQ